MVISPPFYSRYIKLPVHDQVPPEIHDNPKLYPFFKDCRGAVDGTHIESFVPEDAASRYRDRKGGISQNVLAACTFDMRFCYVLSGWEGSAADGRVFEDARRNDFAVHPGTYYLADAGFPACHALLVPYRRERYHLKEWGRAPQKYNYSFSSALHNSCLITDHKIPENSSTFVIHKHEMSLSAYSEWSKGDSALW